jgi:sugar (pentulose or hexulose) kinase
VGIGIHPDFQTAIREMTRVRDTFEPDAKNHETYEQLYQGVYKQMYKRLRPLYQVMRKK